MLCNVAVQMLSSELCGTAISVIHMLRYWTLIYKEYSDIIKFHWNFSELLCLHQYHLHYCCTFGNVWEKCTVPQIKTTQSKVILHYIYHC